MNGALNWMPRQKHALHIGRAWLLALILAVGLHNLVASAPAGERVALVIGNSAYDFAPALRNPRNDAKAVAAALDRLGFRVIKGIDADRVTMQALVRAFSTEVEGARLALFYYAGHGLQLNGKNYLVPVDARLERERDVDFQTMDVNFVLRQMERGERVNIVVLDACRNNPLSEKLARSMGERAVFLGHGLARMETGVGSLVAFSTQPGNVALDGLGANSPFAKALLDNIETPGLDVDVLMRRVREEVIRLTDGRQVPWSSSSLVGDKVVLRSLNEIPKRSIADPASPLSEAQAKTLEPLKPSGSDIVVGKEISGPQPSAAAPDEQIEITFWNTVRESNNPALIKAYLERYPNGHFALIAETMLAELEAGQQPEGAPPISPSGTPLPREKPQVNLEPAAPPASRQPEAAPKPRKKSVAPSPAKKKRQKKIVTTAPRKAKPPAAKCGYCYECATANCRRRWLCGARYQMSLQQNLCSFHH